MSMVQVPRISFLSLILLCTGLAFTTGCGSKAKKKGLPPEKQITKQTPVQIKEPTPPPAQAGPAPQKSKEAKPHHPRWSYEGVLGPQMWGDLDASYALCKTGDMQSPIDLKWSKPTKGRSIAPSYKTSRLRIIDNGHTVQVNADPGSSISINGEVYQLLQVHFHSQSEHTFSGKHYPMEMHFVHKSKSGKLAVVGRMLMVGSKSDPTIAKIWANLPKSKSMEMEAAGHSIDFMALVPKKLTYYNYAGSLTTPPCSQGVDWNVLNTPLEISKDQLTAFRALYANNFRPVQPLNGRKPINY